MKRAKATSGIGWLGRSCLGALAAATLSGCVGYRSVTGDAIAAPAEVRIQFAPPREIVVHAATQDSTIIREVVEIYGRVTEREGDMVTLEVSRARARMGTDRPAPVRFASGAVTRVPIQNIAVRETRSGRTVLLVLGLVVVAAIVIGAATAPDPEPPPEKEPKTA